MALFYTSFAPFICIFSFIKRSDIAKEQNTRRGQVIS